MLWWSFVVWSLNFFFSFFSITTEIFSALLYSIIFINELFKVKQSRCKTISFESPISIDCPAAPHWVMAPPCHHQRTMKSNNNKIITINLIGISFRLWFHECTNLHWLVSWNGPPHQPTHQPGWAPTILGIAVDPMPYHQIVFRLDGKCYHGQSQTHHG